MSCGLKVSSDKFKMATLAGLELEMSILDDRGKMVVQHRNLTKPIQCSVIFVILIPYFVIGLFVALGQASCASFLPSLSGLSQRV